MKTRSTILRSLVFVLLASTLTAGCAKRLSDVTAQDVPRLETRVAERPDDPDAKVQLGIAYHQADRFEDARATLREAIDSLGASSGAAYLFLGLTNEEVEDWTGARQAYSEYLDAGRSDALGDEIRARLTFVVHRGLRAEARRALAQEAALSDQPPTNQSVAVFPYRVATEREDLEPLSVALADMMITDLALSGGLTVLERTRIQTLLDEMALTEAGYTEPETGARAGRLLRAEHVVQGAVTTLDQETLSMTTDVRHTVQGESPGQASFEDALTRLFGMEKETVFRILEVLGVDLTPAERQAINENRAENLLAFLTYGQGLQAKDRGDYELAAQLFQEAAEMDPTFQRAAEQYDEASQLVVASRTSTEELFRLATTELSGYGDPEGSDATTRTGTESRLQRSADWIVPNRGVTMTSLGSFEEGGDTQTTDRDPLQEATRTESITRLIGTVRVIIQALGGER